MSWLVVVTVAVVSAIAIAVALLLTLPQRSWRIGWLRRSTADVPSTYVGKGSLLTEAEQRFARTLEHAVGRCYRIAMKLRLADLLEPRTAGRGARDRATRARLEQSSVDFILCDALTWEVLAAIRLTGVRGRADTPEEIRFIEDALRPANIHFIAIDSATNYVARDLAAEIESILTRDFVKTLTLAAEWRAERALDVGYR